MLLCAPGHYPAKQPEPRAAKPYLHFVRSISHASARFANALTAAQATIVLPAFIRSCSADGERENKRNLGDPKNQGSNNIRSSPAYLLRKINNSLNH
jgi:hypothetical protein